MTTPRIFVSHSKSDHNFCLRLVNDLRRVLGDDSAVWYDAQGGLQGGDIWWQKIMQELKTRNVFMVVLSPDAAASSWVNSEIDLAWKQMHSSTGKIIIPILYRKCQIRDDLDLIQRISFLQPKTYMDAFKELILALELLTDVDVRKVTGLTDTNTTAKDPQVVLDGELKTLGLPTILKMLSLSGKTGTLFVHSELETLSISLRKGQIIAVHEEEAQQDLLRMLYLINKLDLAKVQTLREQAQNNLDLVQTILVEEGWVSDEEMHKRLKFAATQSVSHALQWVNGGFSFHRQLIAIENRMQPLDIDSVLLEAMRQADEWEKVMQERVTHLTRTTVTHWLPEVSKLLWSIGVNHEKIRLNHEIVEVLSLSNGELPLQAVAMILMKSEAQIARILMHLMEMHLVGV